MISKVFKNAVKVIRGSLGPLFVMSLAYVPIDIGSSVLWAVGGGLFLRAVYIIVITMPSVRKNYLNLISPALVCVLLLLSGHLVGYSFDVAKARARHEAESIQQQCFASKACPDIPPGWEEFKGEAYKMEGYTAKYKMMYLTDSSHKEFTLKLIRNIDYFYTAVGGVDQNVNYIEGQEY